MNENNLNETKELETLKREYESIPIPEGLEFRVRSSIAQAKNAENTENAQNTQSTQARESHPAKKHRYLRKVFGTCAAAMLTVVVLANSGAGVAHAMEQVPLLGLITKVVTFRTYEDQRGDTVSATINVPEVENGGELNDAIQAYTDTIIAEYEKDAASSEEYANDPDAPTAETNHYELNLDYTVATDSAALFALRFNKSVVMASGNESVKIYNVDKATGKILTLGDLFQSGSGYLDVLTKNIQAQMRTQMDADENLYYWLDDEVTDWNFTALDPDTAFYVNENGQLTIVFNEGDVAPMYMGVVEFTIPTNAISDIAVPGYLK
ncbi:Anti-sigma-V factor RsiV [anaerobic digester metagenome]